LFDPNLRVETANTLHTGVLRQVCAPTVFRKYPIVIVILPIVRLVRSPSIQLHPFN